MSASAASRRALRLFVSSSLCLLPSLAAVSRPRFGSPARTPRARATTKSQLPQDSFPPPRAVFRARPPRIGRPRAHARGFDPLPLQTDQRQGHRRPPASHRGEASLDGGRRGFNPDCRTVHTRSKRVPPAPSGSVATDVEPVRPPNPRASRAPAARARRDDPSAIHSATPETRRERPTGPTRRAQLVMCSRRRGCKSAPALWPVPLVLAAIGRSRAASVARGSSCSATRPAFFRTRL